MFKKLHKQNSLALNLNNTGFNAATGKMLLKMQRFATHLFGSPF